MKRLFSTTLLLGLLSGLTIVAQQKKKEGPPKSLKWRIQQLHKDNNEGIAVGDIDGDGKLDVTAGEFWYQNPDFKKRRVRTILPFGKDYMQNNSEHLYDVDGDGDLDIVAGAFTLPIVNWFENPAKITIRLIAGKSTSWSIPARKQRGDFSGRYRWRWQTGVVRESMEANESFRGLPVCEG